MKMINWNDVSDVGEKLAPGGYVCGITAVEDIPEKEYLKLEYDVAEGPQKNYYRTLYQNKGFWGGNFVKSYKEKALPFFKAFKTAVENSNPGYTFNNDEKTLVRKLVGLVLGEEEYVGNDGAVKTRLYVAEIHSADRIRKGNFKVPPLKALTGQPQKSSTPGSASNYEEAISDGDCPF